MNAAGISDDPPVDEGSAIGMEAVEVVQAPHHTHQRRRSAASWSHGPPPTTGRHVPPPSGYTRCYGNTARPQAPQGPYVVPPGAPVINVSHDLPLRDTVLLDLVAAAVARGGPTVEEELARREGSNPFFEFLQAPWSDARLLYYRWRLFSLLQGDLLTAWRTEPFQMERSPSAYVWVPPQPSASGQQILQEVVDHGLRPPPCTPWVAQQTSSDRQLFVALDDTTESAWRDLLRPVDAAPTYKPLCGGGHSTPPPGAAAVRDHLREWSAAWQGGLLQQTAVAARLTFAVEHADAPHHLLSVLLDEVLRTAQDSCELSRRISAQDGIFSPLEEIERDAVGLAVPCLWQLFYVFVLHDMLSNAKEEALDEAGVARAAQEEVGSKRPRSASQAASKTAAETHDVFGVPLPPVSGGARRQKTEAAVSDAARERRRRAGWAAAAETVLPTLIEAVALTALNAIQLTATVATEACHSGLPEAFSDDREINVRFTAAPVREQTAGFLRPGAPSEREVAETIKYCCSGIAGVTLSWLRFVLVPDKGGNSREKRENIVRQPSSRICMTPFAFDNDQHLTCSSPSLRLPFPSFHFISSCIFDKRLAVTAQHAALLGQLNPARRSRQDLFVMGIQEVLNNGGPLTRGPNSVSAQDPNARRDPPPPGGPRRYRRLQGIQQPSPSGAPTPPSGGTLSAGEDHCSGAISMTSPPAKDSIPAIPHAIPTPIPTPTSYAARRSPLSSPTAALEQHQSSPSPRRAAKSPSAPRRCNDVPSTEPPELRHSGCRRATPMERMTRRSEHNCFPSTEPARSDFGLVVAHSRDILVPDCTVQRADHTVDDADGQAPVLWDVRVECSRCSSSATPSGQMEASAARVDRSPTLTGSGGVGKAGAPPGPLRLSVTAAPECGAPILLEIAPEMVAATTIADLKVELGRRLGPRAVTPNRMTLRCEGEVLDDMFSAALLHPSCTVVLEVTTPTASVEHLTQRGCPPPAVSERAAATRSSVQHMDRLLCGSLHPLISTEPFGRTPPRAAFHDPYADEEAALWTVAEVAHHPGNRRTPTDCGDGTGGVPLEAFEMCTGRARQLH
eukprot:gene8467-5943_t